MIRTPLIAALAVALLGGTALAAPANAPPANLSDSARSAPDYDRNGDDGDDYGPPPAYNDSQYNRAAPQGQPQQVSQADRDMFCRRDAAARTGYTTPGEAARDEQARGTIGGTLGGAALGAIIGGATGGNAGTGAAIGAGAGLLAGTAVGANNADRAARNVQADYGSAYYACMGQADNGTPAGYYPNGAPRPGYGDGYDGGYAYGPPPPPVYYGAPYGYPYYPYYYGPSYGPSVSFGFGFGGGHRGWGGGHRGYHGGGRGGRHR